MPCSRQGCAYFFLVFCVSIVMIATRPTLVASVGQNISLGCSHRQREKARANNAGDYQAGDDGQNLFLTQQHCTPLRKPMA